MFGTCEFPFKAPGSYIPRAQEAFRLHAVEEMLAHGYELPSERICSSAVLSLATEQWLAGKRERRLKFAEDMGGFGAIFHRLMRCPAQEQGRGSEIVEAYSLDGTSFSS